MIRRVLVLASWFPSDRCPVDAVFIQEQAQALSERFDVAVLVPGVVGWRQVVMRLVPRSRSTMEWLGSMPVCREQDVVPYRGIRPLWEAAYLRATARGLRRILREWGVPHVIHAHVVWPGGMGAVYLKKRFSIPVVLTEHSGPFAMHLGSHYMRRRVRKTLDAMDHLIAVSPHMAGQIRAFGYRREISIVGDLVRTRFFVPADTEATRSALTGFLCVASMVPQKGLDDLLRTARILLDRGRTAFKVYLGGDGVLRPELEELARHLELSAHCEFLGMLSREQVRAWMQRCDVFVTASLGETFSIVLGEAMACGKPVIATRCGGPEFVVTPETGLLVEKANPVALADAMERFMAGQTHFDLRRIRQSVVSRFGEEAFLDNVSAVYQQLGSGRAG